MPIIRPNPLSPPRDRRLGAALTKLPRTSLGVPLVRSDSEDVEEEEKEEEEGGGGAVILATDRPLTSQYKE